MEIISSAFDGTLDRILKRRRYERFDSGYKKSVKTVTVGGRKRRFWRIKVVRRLRLKKASPIRLWIKLKKAYVEMMLRCAKPSRVPKNLQVSDSYSMDEFQRRVIYEITKSLYASRELATR